MPDENTPDLGPIVRQQPQILTEIGAVRDGMAVLTAIVVRQDGKLSMLLTEVRAMHARHGRLANRIRDFEAQN